MGHEDSTVRVGIVGCGGLGDTHATHVVEKPLAHSLEAARQVVSAERDSNAFCMVGFRERYEAASEIAKAYQRRGYFGDIRHIETHRVRRRGIPNYGTWFTNRELSGGGALIDIDCYDIDLVLYLLDFPAVEEVMGVTRNDVSARADYADPDGSLEGDKWTEGESVHDVEDSASALVRCENGATISLEVAWATNRDAVNRTVVRGTEAGARIPGADGAITLYDTGTAGVDHYADTEIGGELEPRGIRGEDEHFLDSVADGDRPDVTAEQGMAVQRVIDAIYRSSEENRAQSL